MSKIRCFIAFHVSDVLEGPVTALMKKLAACDAAVKWVEPENLHLTLKFFGNIDDVETYSIAKSMKSVARSFDPLRVSLQSVGAFPSTDKPRVVWVGATEGVDQLRDLHGKLDAALDSLGYARERRQFHPHVTLGRVVGAPSHPLTEALSALSEAGCGQIELSSMVLFRSELQKNGAVYTPLATVPLAAPKPTGDSA